MGVVVLKISQLNILKTKDNTNALGPRTKIGISQTPLRLQLLDCQIDENFVPNTIIEKGLF